MDTELETIKESAVATQEVAKAASNAIDAGREMGGFVSRFISAPLEQGVGILEDKLKFMRWERQLRFIQKANELLEQQALGAPDVPVPLKNAIPLLEYASLEENDSLQNMWAQLLVNGTQSSTGVNLERSFIEILSQISALEAKILMAVYSLPFEASRHSGVLTYSLPEQAIVSDDSADESSDPSHEVAMGLANLARLGCLKFGFTWGGGETFSRINPTLMGFEFTKACTAKIKI
ncbi:DUF4393 domain-containing protein [Vibrio parahaemolyticus]|uniref:Abi-alpha family protein n=1 Tax=Vibrio parahaemolyticus TaxID=670 RepID=UPI001124AF47|nr:Abi-alpha family protein [Vibrio parahaemolyticus]EJC6761642.1 DUF4393 domain-containing protein [Vibrio parahaemolyticus]EJC6781661.1 DUF4393 domain-containing protein [Vibrio parahaemolyticus]EJC6809844.1 DUF4393 domain-containing protein [Vibrio parahaemolyticus]EJC6924377.1 DUF4393 domain-containing protein [Vibrio parahaemolyticus]EJC6939787.1 DUF4393 domain-containing protein [Vibrio parahaemolyticus]